MKNCVNCNAEIMDHAQFCPKCGHKQEVTPPVENIEASAEVQAKEEQIASASQVPQQGYTQPQAQMDTPVQQQFYTPPGEPAYAPPQAQAYQPAQGGGYVPVQGQTGQPLQGQQPYPPQGSYAPQPAVPREPSQIALAGKRYFDWLIKGILGTKEPMHILFAAIIPFLTTLIYTLSSAPFYGWHAGGFFLVWFFVILFVAAIPLIAWLLKTYLLKEKIEFKILFAEYASYFNVIFLYSLFAMIFALAISGMGPNNFFYALYKGTLVFSLLAGIAALVSKPDEAKKVWPTLLIMGSVFIVMTFIIVAIEWHALTSWAMWWGW